MRGVRILNSLTPLGCVHLAPLSKEFSSRWWYYLELFNEDEMNFINQLAHTLNTTEDEIEDILFNAPDRYKVYRIPKRTHGFRVIAQPSKELKKCQRAFQELYELPVHHNAMAYRAKKSIKENALAHKNSSYLLKLDLENYFNSITPEIFWQAWSFSKGELPNSDDRRWIEKLLFWNLEENLVLSVGAPSSPLVSNFCMYLFDSLLSEYCASLKVVYTRYADDLTFSTNRRNVLFSVPLEVESLLQEIFLGRLNINKSKTAFSSKAHNRHVTGITITNDNDISLGRDRKRYIKHKVHQFKLGRLDSYETSHLNGMIAFARHIEPKFYESLLKKYSTEVIKNIFEANNEQNNSN